MFDKHSIILNDDEVVESIFNFVKLFKENYLLKLDQDKIKLDPIFMEYVKNSLSAFINSLSIIMSYGKTEKMKLNALKCFEEILAKKSNNLF